MSNNEHTIEILYPNHDDHGNTKRSILEAMLIKCTGLTGCQKKKKLKFVFSYFHPQIVATQIKL